MSDLSDPTNPLSWVARAEEDWVVAGLSLRRKTPLTNSACFHAQQCAEKYLKAVLVAQGRYFPKTHDLVDINALCAQAGVLVPVNITDLRILTDYAVRTRYPDDPPTPDEARAAIATARAVRRFVRTLLPIP